MEPDNGSRGESGHDGVIRPFPQDDKQYYDTDSDSEGEEIQTEVGKNEKNK